MCNTVIYAKRLNSQIYCQFFSEQINIYKIAALDERLLKNRRFRNDYIWNEFDVLDELEDEQY